MAPLRILLWIGVCLLPLHASAGVSFSEIAWMGTEVSSADEWIELYNDTAQSISVDGWTLKAKDGSPSISLSGAIMSGGYYLIERTDDDTVPGIPADIAVSFGRGMSNDGETLLLVDQNGVIVDEVVGGTNWKSIGGDGKTKDTPQNVGGVWVTRQPTPRSAPPAPSAEVVPPSVPVTEIRTKQNDPIQKDPLQQKVISPTSAVLSTTSDAELSSSTPLVMVYGEEKTEEGEDRIPQEATLPLLGTVLLLGSSAVLYIREKTKTEAEKYEIIEDETDE